jgi:cyclopropane fatty-acyl-phospholipid synthase-like methyltransferase
MLDSTRGALIATYYDVCWGTRFAEGHNPSSHAIHYGIYTADSDPPETAKLNTNRYVERLASIERGSSRLRVLDAGCGVGGTAIDVAARHPQVEIVGLTLSAQQVELASGFARDAGVSERVRFARGDYADTGLAPASFDIIWAIESFCHAVDRRAFLREARRLLAPGGRLIVADFFRTSRALDDATRGPYAAICEGFTISDYYDEDLASLASSMGWVTGDTQELTSAVLPGVKRSAIKAAAALEDVTVTRTTLEKAHFLACKLVHQFCVANLLQYRIYRFEPR